MYWSLLFSTKVEHTCIVLYSLGSGEVVSVLVGVAVGVVADCDSLSIETTLTTHNNT